MNPMLSVMAAGKDKVDFSGAWDDLWSSLTKGTGFDSVTNLMAVAGVFLVVLAIVGWAFKKATGKQIPGGQGGIGGALILGCVLCAPSVVLPVVLTLFDLVANAFVSVFVDNTV